MRAGFTDRGRHFFGKKKRGKDFFSPEKGGQTFFFLKKMKRADFFFHYEKGGHEILSISQILLSKIINVGLNMVF